MTFYDWLIIKKDWNNPVGGMARDVIAYDEKDKVKELDYEEWKEYLIGCNACNLVMETFPLIWKKYEKYLEEEKKVEGFEPLSTKETNKGEKHV